MACRDNSNMDSVNIMSSGSVFHLPHPNAFILLSEFLSKSFFTPENRVMARWHHFFGWRLEQVGRPSGGGTDGWRLLHPDRVQRRLRLATVQLPPFPSQLSRYKNAHVRLTEIFAGHCPVLTSNLLDPFSTYWNPNFIHLETLE